MKLGDEITVSSPEWLTSKTGKVIKTFETIGTTFYVVEFPNGAIYTYKDSDLTSNVDKIKQEMADFRWTPSIERDRNKMEGYIFACTAHDIVNYAEAQELLDYISGDAI